MIIELNQTAFYPSSGGQPHDLGTLAGIPVLDVIDEDGRILHVLSAPLAANLTQVDCTIDFNRRLDHMRQHTGQHLLSAVMEETFSLKTVSFHLGNDYATVDVEPQAADPELLFAIEEAANSKTLENLRTVVTFEDAATVQGLRKAPDRAGLLRIVSIEGLDRSACGGTHVKQTGEIGPILLGKTEKIRKALRIEFFCGPRAISEMRRRFTESQAQAQTLKEKMAESDKVRRNLAAELAEMRGQQRFAATQPDSIGRYLWIEELEELNEDARISANSFLLNPGTMAVLTSRSGLAVFFGASPTLGLDCGKILKSALSQMGGKGGGSPKSAQGSVLSLDQLIEISELLRG